ncbi:MAG: type II secretion system inner membrane protein GspF [Natronospirillum sp.]|uniref:type II secretion system inner membrane protein GspF n=1 Tax=Natronospirillum sp. TaxID=2812955 RepID=UPI0025DBAF98|nr:type II secretion system inner membrane protein GspF [Natronospirillum sp.]MCH8551036.1 type II secretion system inner membrane protein GspF [Natronospirillum sp.]
MAAFEYEALDASGRRKKGVIEADSARQVRAQLREKGWVPVALEPAAERKSRGGFLRGPGLSVAELAMVTRQLATLVGSGMPLEECLQAVAEQNEQRRIRSIFLAVRARVMEGYSLAQGLETYPRAFNHQFQATVNAGEQSGKLDLVLLRLADYIEEQDATRRKLQMAATYPVILSLAAIGIIVFLLNSVVPRILEVFASSGQALPAPTRALIATTEFLDNYWLHMIGVIVAAVILFIVWNRSEKRRFLMHRLYLRLPFIGRLIRGFSTARFASTVAMLSGSGVPLVDAMRISASVVTNLPIRQAVQDATRKVSEGGSLSRALSEAGYFQPIMVHMIASGEASGKLDEMLARTARSQEENLKDLITTVMSLLEPLMLVLMGAIVMVIVLSVVLPLTQMNTMI